MTDNMSPAKRSKVMASIKGKDTMPELNLWNMLDHRRFRRYPRIPGNPDIGNKSMKIAIFVDGCFWHGCPLCYKAPATRPKYWASKLLRNKEHDSIVNEVLSTAGFKVLRFWEHQIIGDLSGCAHQIMEAIS